MGGMGVPWEGIWQRGWERGLVISEWGCQQEAERIRCQTRMTIISTTLSICLLREVGFRRVGWLLQCGGLILKVKTNKKASISNQERAGAYQGMGEPDSIQGFSVDFKIIPKFRTCKENIARNLNTRKLIPYYIYQKTVQKF